MVNSNEQTSVLFSRRTTQEHKYKISGIPHHDKCVCVWLRVYRTLIIGSCAILVGGFSLFLNVCAFERDAKHRKSSHTNSKREYVYYVYYTNQFHPCIWWNSISARAVSHAHSGWRVDCLCEWCSATLILIRYPNTGERHTQTHTYTLWTTAAVLVVTAASSGSHLANAKHS